MRRTLRALTLSALLGGVTGSAMLPSPAPTVTPPPSFSLRQQPDRAGLEEALTGLEEEVLFEESVGGERLEPLLRDAWRRSYRIHPSPPPYQVTRDLAQDVLWKESEKVLWQMLHILWEKVWRRYPGWRNLREERIIGDLFSGDHEEWYGINDILFQDILRHLLANAVDTVIGRWDTDVSSMEIKIRSFVKEGNLWIQISDNGKGIAPEILDRIGREKVTTKQEGSGSLGREGKGLLLATESSSQRGWELTVANRSNGQGATASLVISLATGLEELNLVDLQAPFLIVRGVSGREGKQFTSGRIERIFRGGIFDDPHPDDNGLVAQGIIREGNLGISFAVSIPLGAMEILDSGYILLGGYRGTSSTLAGDGWAPRAADDDDKIPKGALLLNPAAFDDPAYQGQFTLVGQLFCDPSLYQKAFGGSEFPYALPKKEGVYSTADEVRFIFPQGQNGRTIDSKYILGWVVNKAGFALLRPILESRDLKTPVYGPSGDLRYPRVLSYEQVREELAKRSAFGLEEVPATEIPQRLERNPELLRGA